MKRIFFVIFLTVCFQFFLGDIISPEIKYSNSDKSKYDVTATDFTKSQDVGEIIDIEGGRVLLMIKFLSKISSSSLKFYLNDKRISNLFTKGHYDPVNKTFIIDLSKEIRNGKNELEINYAQKTGTKEIKKWEFYLSSIQPGEDFSKRLPKQLTSGPGWKRNFSISPDGRLVAYIVSGTTENSINIYNFENGKEENVITSKKKKKFGVKTDEEKFYSFKPHWSRDGSFLFFISTESGYHEIYRAKISYTGKVVGQKKQLTDFRAYTSDLFLSTKIDRMLFISDKADKAGEIALYSIEGAENIESPVDFEKNLKIMKNGR